eukprot:113176-Chlamydomonas_euryale.AAC.1
MMNDGANVAIRSGPLGPWFAALSSAACACCFGLRCPRRPQGCRARSAAKWTRGDGLGPGIRAPLIRTSGRSSCSRELDVWSCRSFGSSPNAHRLRADS